MALPYDEPNVHRGMGIFGSLLLLISRLDPICSMLCVRVSVYVLTSQAECSFEPSIEDSESMS